MKPDIELNQAISNGEAAIVKWVSKFAENQDNRNTRVFTDYTQLAKQLTDAGYSGYNPQNRPHDLNTNPHSLAEVIIGQAINSLQNSRDINSMVTKFAQDYANMSNSRSR